MSHIFALVQTRQGMGKSSGELGVACLRRFKAIEPSLSRDEQWVQVTIAPRWSQQAVPFVRDETAGVWLTWTGVWTYQDDIVNPRDAGALLRRYVEVGPERVGMELQGQFAIIIGDSRTKELIAITDRCGSLHLFCAALKDGVALCSSSAVLSSLLGAEKGSAHDQLDTVGVHEFIATGIVFEERTLWSHVRKIGAGTVCRVSAEGVKQNRYWSFAALSPEKYGLKEAVELTMKGITHSATQIARAFPAIVSDLTGGYDSRALICGLLKAGAHFETTVSGSADCPDVTVSNRIAQTLSIHHMRQEIEPSVVGQNLMRALRWTDGEYDVFDYARIAAIHMRLAQSYQIGLNGSFGELARGYWWELIWPGLTRRKPLSAELLSHKRFGAVPYCKAIFSQSGTLDLHGHIAEILARTLEQVQDFPKSTQMDALYYYQRMGRWQGRIVSCTNQIWPCVSPFSFPQLLVPILETKADARFGSKLIRTMFDRYHPILASIPLEHGYPPRPVTALNFWKFMPLLAHYAHRAERKIAPKILSVLRVNQVSTSSGISLKDRFPYVFGATESGIDGNKPLLLDTGLFDERTLVDWFNPGTVLNERFIEQWRRVVTVELLLRALQTIRLDID